MTIPCVKIEEITALSTTQKYMIEKLESIEKKLDRFIETAESKYVTRLEFRAVTGVLWALATIVGLIAYFNK